MTAPLTIPARFKGPPRSGNGGWTAGALAAYLTPGPVQVTLRTPPPLEVALTVEVDAGDGPAGQAARALHGDVLVAEAEAAAADLDPVPAVDVEVARAAEQTYAGHRSHPFPTCFVCGTDRGAGDGLRIFPGRVDDVDGRARMAATWTPDPSLGDDVTTLAVAWAALDCVGGWAGDLEERLMVLGRMTAHVRDLPRVGETHVVVGTALGTDGRRTRTAATLRTASGRVLGTAEHVWFAVDPEDFS